MGVKKPRLTINNLCSIISDLDLLQMDNDSGEDVKRRDKLITKLSIMLRNKGFTTIISKSYLEDGK